MLLIEGVYLISAVALAAYGFNSLFHCWLFWRGKKQPILHLSQNEPSISEFPAVTVQLPIYNERHVASRLVEAVLRSDWPTAQLQIQVLDDSTDDTTNLVAATIARQTIANQGERAIALEHIRRDSRIGYKAGALEEGMKSATGEFIVIFDADFIPPADFLKRTIPHFADPQVGCVQTRWGHVNPETSLLTEAQALGIDGHFQIEQFVRSQIGAFLNFNGTAGAWRRSAMEAVGGWEHDTLTEDLDLSYRTQLGGWRISYQNDILVPAELPVQIDAFKRQQFRWAKGSLQTAIKLLKPLWLADQPLWRKILGTLHLTNYLVHPFMILNLLLLLPIMSSQSAMLHIAPYLTTAAVGPPIMYWLAMKGRPDTLWTKVRRLAVLMALGTGLSVNNSKAAFEAFTGIDSEFKRTPKFAIGSDDDSTIEPSSDWHESAYALPRDPTVWIELLMALYAGGLFIYALQAGIWWVLIWILMYAIGYGSIATMAIRQSWQVRYAQAALQMESEA